MLVSELFDILGEILLGLLDLLLVATEGVIGVFYTSETGFTIYGVFLILGLAFWFMMFAWRVIQGFMRRKG